MTIQEWWPFQIPCTYVDRTKHTFSVCLGNAFKVPWPGVWFGYFVVALEGSICNK
jgi:hypothetical protein